MIRIISKQIINLLLKNTKLNSSIVLIIIQRSFSLIKKQFYPNQKKKLKFNLQFKMVSYLCTQLQEEKFELIATSS
jgi:hypothetical protein